MRPPLRLLPLALLAAVASGALAGCDAASTGDEAEGTPVLRVADLHALDGTVGPPVPTLLVATDSVYGCVNYPLSVRFEREEDALDLTVLGVEPIEICLTALGPATARVPLDVPAGTYRLRVRHDGATDEYELGIGADRLALGPVRAAVTRAPEPLAWRYPERSFAYSCGTLRGEKALCDAFRQRLEASLDLTEIDAPDRGVWPYARATDGYHHNAPARYYRYRAEPDFDAAKALLREFSHDVLRGHEGDGLSVENWRGDVGPPGSTSASSGAGRGGSFRVRPPRPRRAR